jgi:hypothetical protein
MSMAPRPARIGCTRSVQSDSCGMNVEWSPDATRLSAVNA